MTVQGSVLISAHFMPKNDFAQPDSWHVLIIGLPLTEDAFDLGAGLTIRRLLRALSTFDLAAAGAVGLREWAVLEPLAASATAEIVSPTRAATLPGYDALNKCWLASALLVIRGFARHLCPAVSAYSWNFIAGHESETSDSFRQQMAEEGVKSAAYHPRFSLSPFQGGILDYHLQLLAPKEVRTIPFDSSEAQWFSIHLEKFNQLAAKDERFRFGLEACVDWRYAKDRRAAIARLWAGIESWFGISSELVYRISLLASTVVAPRGPERLAALQRLKKLYGIRSKAVHGEPLADDVLSLGLGESFELLRTLVLDAVERGQLRDDADYQSELLC